MPPEPISLTGSCLCGGVRYRVHGDIDALAHCHCSRCRKAHGAAFGTYGWVAPERFEWLSGEALVKGFRSSDRVTRTFCGECGSNLQFLREGRKKFGLAVATLDDAPSGKAVMQIWTADKAPWWPLTEEPACYEGDAC